jgi:hypothetical protein
MILGSVQLLDAETTTVLNDAHPASLRDRGYDMPGQPIDCCLMHGVSRSPSLAV